MENGLKRPKFLEVARMMVDLIKPLMIPDFYVIGAHMAQFSSGA